MTDKKLSQLPTGTTIQSTDLFYSAQDAGGSFTSVYQPWSAILAALPTGSGNVSNVGTPVNGQLAQWTDATHIQGINASTITTRTQRLVSGAAGVITPAGTDQIINVNWTSGTSGSYTLPLANTRAGVPITFKDIGGTFFTRPLTINRSGSDTIEGLTSMTLSNNFSGLTLVPCNDGTTVNLWYVT